MIPRPSLPRRVFHTALLALTLIFLGLVMLPNSSHAESRADYALGAGDSIRVQVFQNPDLSMEARLSENGRITYPLIGAVDLNGLSVSDAEIKISQALKNGGFLLNPQISISLVQVRNNQVSVLGQVAKPGRFPLDTAGTRVTDMLANAGGVVPGGDDVAIVTGTRDGTVFRALIDIPAIFLQGTADKNTVLQGGDTVYVHRAAVFYIYGEAQHSGAYRLERDMTVMQAMALGGGPTNRGSENRLRLHRKAVDGHMQQLEPQLTDLVLPNDVLYIKESIF